MSQQFEVIIIGGSYAGLSAAMGLGRARRKTLIIDTGKPCNQQTPYAHNFLTRDGETPAAIAYKAKEQVMAYPSIQFLDAEVVAASGVSNNFQVTTGDGQTFGAQKLLFATGVKDVPLPIKGFAECWGISVLHCPYCHGYEMRDEPLGIITTPDMALHFAQLIYNWSKDLKLFTNGPADIDPAHREKILAHGISISEQEIEAIAHEEGQMKYLLFKDGSRQPLTAVFARAKMEQHCKLPALMGCELHTEGFYNGLIKIDEFGKTTVPGIFAAGDNTIPFRSVAAAVSGGNKAGPFINSELITEAF